MAQTIQIYAKPTSASLRLWLWLSSPAALKLLIGRHCGWLLTPPSLPISIPMSMVLHSRGSAACAAGRACARRTTTSSLAVAREGRLVRVADASPSEWRRRRTPESAPEIATHSCSRRFLRYIATHSCGWQYRSSVIGHCSCSWQ